VTLSWKINAKNVDYSSANYIVTCTTPNTAPKFEEVVVVDGKATVTITGLNPNKKYKFSVTATNGLSMKTATISATTLKYTAVKSLKTSGKTANSITLKWQPSAAKANTDGYVIEVYNSVGKIINTIHVTGVNITSYTVPGLKAKTKYTFAVKATEGNLLSSAAKISATMGKV
jgi:hypothetical protein